MYATIEQKIQHGYMTDHGIAGSQVAVDTVLGEVGLDDLELGLQTSTSVENRNDLPSSRGDHHV